MSRLKQNRIIDSAIKSVAAITESQCSLSDTDQKVAEEALQRLQLLKKKKGKTNVQIQQEITAIVVILITFFAKAGIDASEEPTQ